MVKFYVVYFTTILKKLPFIQSSVPYKTFSYKVQCVIYSFFCLVIIPLSQMRELKCCLTWGHKQDLGMRPLSSHPWSIFLPLHIHTEAKTWAAWSAHEEQSY